VGVFTCDSDYDFLVVADSRDELRRWLEDSGFTRDNETYGTDPRLLSSDTWTQKWDGWPSIDLIPVTPAEAEMRLRWFRAMVKVGDSKAGRLARGLKAEKAWPYLWAVLAGVVDDA
jgi:hypothetical protein